MSTQPGSGWSQPFIGHDLPRLRQALRRQAHGSGLTGDALEDFVTAVHELLVNAVRHGGGRGVVHLRREDGTLICAVTDSGPGPAVAPSVAAQPPASSYGGRGLWLAHHLTDGLVLSRTADGFTATVTVSLARAADDGEATG
jgi:anti-sigma regulatory factor (Ser/Thr protein kinase)